jgi:quercetin dioxygenase-like cupin family protein
MKRKHAWIAALLVAGCGGTAPAPTQEPARGETLGDEMAQGPGEEGAGQGGVDPEELRVAAIERAMNQVSPAAHLCWAAGAADDYLLAGDVRVLVSLDERTRAKASISADTTGDAVLTDCLVRVLEAYPWPSALAGEGVELPFAFRAPHGQNVVDRRFVPPHGQQGWQISVLLDEKNTGAKVASMLEVALAPGASLPVARVDREEVWYALDALTLRGPAGADIALAAGDAAYLRPGTYRGVANPGKAPARWVVVAVPGGREGSARAGALPAVAPPDGKVPRGAPGPEVRRRSEAARYPRASGATTIYFEAAADAGARGKAAKAAPRAVSLSFLEIAAGAAVPPHKHAAETEMLYVLSGSGRMTVEGVELPVGATSAVQVPAGIEHSFTATEATTAVQLYTPPGPEQRFKTLK